MQLDQIGCNSPLVISRRLPTAKRCVRLHDSAAVAAAPTAAYCLRSRSCALADQGINSQSTQSQSEPQVGPPDWPAWQHPARCDHGQDCGFDRSDHQRTAGRCACKMMPARSRVIRDSKSLCRPSHSSRQTITTAREPMCFSSQITCATPFFSVVIKRFLTGCSNSPGSLAGLGRRNRRRQIDQPTRIDCKSAHRFQRGDGVFLAHGDAVDQAQSE